MYRKICLIILPLIISVFGASLISVYAESIQPEILSLEKCLQLAYTNSQELKAATQSVAIAAENVNQAAAGFWPVAGYEADALTMDQKSTLTYTNQVYSGKLFLTQPLYTGGKLDYALELSRLNLKKASEEERQTRLNITYQVKEAYFNVWLAEEMVKVSQASYDNLGLHLKQVEKLFQVGTASKFELLRAEVQHQSLKPQLIAAQNGLTTAKLGLATLIGFNKEQDFTVEYDPATLPTDGADQLAEAKLLEFAYQNRSELRLNKYLAEIGAIQTALATAESKPEIGLTLEYEGAGVEAAPGSWTKYWTLALVAQGDIFNGTTKPKINAAQGQEKLYAIRELGLKDQIRLETQQALQSIKENLEKSRANQANIALAQETSRMTQARFEAGMATTMDIRDAQLDLDKALTGYYDGVASYLTALAKVDLVLGKDI